jgi:hypothetical protein
LSAIAFAIFDLCWFDFPGLFGVAAIGDGFAHGGFEEAPAVHLDGGMPPSRHHGAHSRDDIDVEIRTVSTPRGHYRGTSDEQRRLAGVKQRVIDGPDYHLRRR